MLGCGNLTSAGSTIKDTRRYLSFRFFQIPDPSSGFHHPSIFVIIFNLNTLKAAVFPLKLTTSGVIGKPGSGTPIGNPYFTSFLSNSLEEEHLYDFRSVS